MPPPSTRSSSLKPVGVRSTSAASISLSTVSSDAGARPFGLLLRRFLLPLGASATVSTRLFQALQLGHLPSQRVLLPPHSLQT